MQVTSIDNMDEDDGIVNLQSFLMGLNAEPVGPLKRRLVAIVPELRDDGRLDRLDCVTCDWEDPGPIREDDPLTVLLLSVADVVEQQQRHRAEALAKLDAAPPITIEPVDDDKKPGGR